MHLFLTSVLPLLAHDHASAAAFLTCRHHNFHASIIPEFLSDEKRVKSFCEARQQKKLKADEDKQCKHLYNLFVQTPLMQFSPSLLLLQRGSAESILKPLLETKYFTRTLQRCAVAMWLTNDLFQDLSKVQSLAKLDFDWGRVEHEHLDIIIDCFLNLESLTIRDAADLRKFDPFTVRRSSTLSTSLRCLRVERVYSCFASEFVPMFSKLRKLVLSAVSSGQQLDLLPLSSALPLLAHLELEDFTPQNTSAVKSLVHLSLLQFRSCKVVDLSFLVQDALPQLTTLCIDSCHGLSTSSFASLAHAPNLHVLTVWSYEFNNDCLQYLENMVHLRKLDLSNSRIVGDSRSLKTSMLNMFQLEELNLMGCNIGDQGAISTALYNTHSRLRVLNLRGCDLVDDDLHGIGALKNTLEVINFSGNWQLTGEALVHCKDLMKLKVLNLYSCDRINDLSPLKDCVNLEELSISVCGRLADDSFKVFSEEPNSFCNLCVLDLSYCHQLTENVFQHLSKNNHLVHRLKELNVRGNVCNDVVIVTGGANQHL